AEDGIRDKLVTGVQTCALPIYVWGPEGTHLPITPDFKGSLVARFNLNPIGKWEPYIQGNWTYQSSASVQLRVDQSAVVGAMPPRSEERRVGKECGSGWWSARWE